MGLAVAARRILVQLRDTSSDSCGCHVGRYRRDALSAAPTCCGRFAKPVSSSRMTLGACDLTIVELNTDNNTFFFFFPEKGTYSMSVVVSAFISPCYLLHKKALL